MASLIEDGSDSDVALQVVQKLVVDIGPAIVLGVLPLAHSRLRPTSLSIRREPRREGSPRWLLGSRLAACID